MSTAAKGTEVEILLCVLSGAGSRVLSPSASRAAAAALFSLFEEGAFCLQKATMAGEKFCGLMLLLRSSSPAVPIEPAEQRTILPTEISPFLEKNPAFSSLCYFPK